jgi:outer membrane cobalamin receptor
MKTKDVITALSIGAALVGGVGVSSGQTANTTTQPEPPRFNTEVVVTPERGEAPRDMVAAATGVLEGADLQQWPIVAPAEILIALPGFNAARAEFHVDRPVISSRGFFGGGEADYVLLLVDGVPVSDVESGLINWSLFPALSSIRRVEAARGPGASLYGDAAIGGVIQVLTDQDKDVAELSAAAGSFSTLTTDGVYGRRRRALGFNVTGAARRTDGGITHSGGEQQVIGSAADGVAGAFSWRFSVAADHRERDDPGSMDRRAFVADPYGSDPLFQLDGVQRHGFSGAFTIRRDAAKWRPQARVYATRRREDLIRTILLVPGLGDRRARELSSDGIGASITSDHQLGARGIPVRVGLDVSRERLDLSYHSVSAAGAIGALNTQAAGHRIRTGAFASSSWAPGSRLRLSGAVRWDGVADTGFAAQASADEAPLRAWSPRVGAVLKISEPGSVVLFGQVSRAFKVPTLDQLFDPRPYPDFRGGTFSISNPRLIPQRATNFEAGISGGKTLHWSALAYRMRVDDEIDFDVRTFSYSNIGRSHHTGFEVEAERSVSKYLRPSIRYTEARVRDDEGSGQLKNVPRHVLNVSTAIELPWALAASARYDRVWGSFLDDANAFAIDGRSTIDFRIRRPFRRNLVFVDLLNTTGNVFEEYGFSLASFTGRSVPYVYGGAPRALRAGVTVAF